MTDFINTSQIVMKDGKKVRYVPKFRRGVDAIVEEFNRTVKEL
jgi:hypothetical protein